MVTTNDIIERLAGRLPIPADALTCFASGLEMLVTETLANGEDVELMTFGTLSIRGGAPNFTMHPSLLKDTLGFSHDT